MAVAAAALLLSCGGRQIAAAQGDAGPLDQVLKAQIKITKFDVDSSGFAVTDADTVLVIEKGGILAVPPANLTLGTATYKDGELHSPPARQRMFLGAVTRLLPIARRFMLRDGCEREERPRVVRGRGVRLVQRSQSAILLQGYRDVPVRQGISGDRHDRSGG
jgi:hypothetical protein